MIQSKAQWPVTAIDLAQRLHETLSLNDTNWHQLKSNSKRRAAELFAGAIVQLINEGENNDIEEMLNQGILWLNNEIKDPGCPKSKSYRRLAS